MALISSSLLKEQSHRLICKRNVVKDDDDDDLENLSYDIALASKSLHVLELRREIGSTRAELSDSKDLINRCGVENVTDNWIDYIQDTMEHLSILLKKGIEASSDDPAKAKHDNSGSYDEYEYFEEAASPKDFVYYSNRLYRDDSSPSESSTNSSRPSSIVIPSVDSDITSYDLRTRSNLTRRHTMDNEGVSAARFFIGNLGLKKAPSKASITTFISQEQTSAKASLHGSGNLPLLAEQCEDNDHHSSPAERQLSQLIVQESTEEVSDEFADAVEKQDDYHIRKRLEELSLKDLNSFSQAPIKKSSSSCSLPNTLCSVPEDDSSTLWVCTEEDYEGLDSAPSSNIQISLRRSKPTNLFAEEVNVGNPVRVGTGYGSYIAYTCTVKGQEGANIVARKRYSDFIRLRSQLIKAQPKYKKLIPCLPPKRVVGKFMPEFIERRRKDLEYFLSYILLHPVLGSTMVVRRWFMD
ncbi:4845_t:CDS:2 [Acaulospora morrowiae]|uniref:Endosomal/vacuolar adapter protein YPT35 n=1 Tax=Acaulospora morrowiae TaxID=94023 RepID=A0A9N9BN83_9GLOM|nr:4845_t:CDS:2 [Acaulospora morrowiae]